MNADHTPNRGQGKGCSASLPRALIPMTCRDPFEEAETAMIRFTDTMTDHLPPPRDDRRDESPLLSDEPTIELVVRARGGDRPAMEALLERCLPPLKRWAHGRLPAAARGNLDT